MLTPVSIRTLAEFIHRQGDLYPALGGRVTAEEGIRAQRLAQESRGGTYQREVAVSSEISRAGLTFRLSGRLDGCDLDHEPPLVEEIKTTRADPAEAERQLGSAHWAQGRLYAALLAEAHPEIGTWLVRLTYCHPDSGVQTPFEQPVAAEALHRFLMETLDHYAAWMTAQLDYAAGRDAWLEERVFPYGGFRAHQRAMAGRVFRAFRDGEHLLLEAPTGSGKTMGVLYPALKALAGGHVQRLFYLTSRGTGALAPLKACRDLAEGGSSVRVVELIAKEKACPVEGMPCDDRCAHAVGYYDRIHGAVSALLACGEMTAAEVQAVAQAHRVCPFELSLDAALWADLVIGDYNYLLDPVVRLQRFAEDDGLGLLIDESHQLTERTREMLTLRLTRSEVRDALQESPPAALGRRLKGLDRALLALGRALPDASGHREDGRASWDAGETVVAEPQGVLRAIGRTVEALADAELDLTGLPGTRALLFNLFRWVRADGWVNGDDFRYLAVRLPGRGVRNLRLTLACLDPAAYLGGILNGYGPHVRFSGTLSPLDLHQALHGQDGGAAERVESLFAPEQLVTLVVTDLPVYYRQRTRTLPRLADLLADIGGGRGGNYLVALPSFDYLRQLAAALDERHPTLTHLDQTPGMSDAERAAFLDGFRDDGRTRLGLIVLGGLFAESVDFSDATLAGVICVGVGLPPGSTLREEMAAHYRARLGEGGGETVAYQQPAMTRVLQMAGRLLRGPTDRGLVCLVDDRFARADYQRFFPRHWRPEPIRAAEVAGRLKNFWQAARLRTPSTSPQAEAVDICDP